MKTPFLMGGYRRGAGVSPPQSHLFCPRKAMKLIIESECKTCPEYDPQISFIYDHCRVKKEESDRLKQIRERRWENDKNSS